MVSKALVEVGDYGSKRLRLLVRIEFSSCLCVEWTCAVPHGPRSVSVHSLANENVTRETCSCRWFAVVLIGGENLVR